MKKILLPLFILLTLLVQGQEKKHEISIDIADALIMQSVELNYEFFVSEKSSFGLSGLLNFAKKSADFRYNEDNMITPFFRHYFTDDRNWNYFGEIFMGINSGEEKNIEYTDGALGVSAGIKYVSEGGFTITALGGVGRNMFGDNSPVIVPRAGVNVGYRF